MLLFAEVEHPIWFVLFIVLMSTFLVAVIIALGFTLFQVFHNLPTRLLQRTYVGLAIHHFAEAGDVHVAYHTYHGFLAWFTQTEHRAYLSPSDARLFLGRLMRFNLFWGLFAAGSLFIFPLVILNYFAQRRSIAAQAQANAKVAGKLAASEQADDAPEQATADPKTAYAIKAGTRPRLEPSTFGQDQIRADAPDSIGQSPAEEAITIVPPVAAPSTYEDSPTDIAIPSGRRQSLFRRFLGWICAGFSALFAIFTIVFLVQLHFEAVLGGVFVTLLFLGVARDWLGPEQ